MVKYFLLPQVIWFPQDLTVDKMKYMICSLNLSFLFCHVKNELGLTTWNGLGSKVEETNFSDSKRLVQFILLSNQQTSRAETQKTVDKGECMQLYDIVFPLSFFFKGSGFLKLLRSENL